MKRVEAPFRVRALDEPTRRVRGNRPDRRRDARLLIERGRDRAPDRDQAGRAAAPRSARRAKPRCCAPSSSGTRGGCRSTRSRASGASSSRRSPMCSRLTAVHIDVSRGEQAMRDSERFHFGFTVPCAAAFRRGGGHRSGGAQRRRSRHVRARRRRGGGRLVDAARRAGRAQGDRAPAVRRAPRPSRGAAGLS